MTIQKSFQDLDLTFFQFMVVAFFFEDIWQLLKVSALKLFILRNSVLVL